MICIIIIMHAKVRINQHIDLRKSTLQSSKIEGGNINTYNSSSNIAHNCAPEWTKLHTLISTCIKINIIESVDSISKDERGFPLTQYITNGRISHGGYTFTHFKHHHRVLRLISYRMGV